MSALATNLFKADGAAAAAAVSHASARLAVFELQVYPNMVLYGMECMKALSDHWNAGKWMDRSHGGLLHAVVGMHAIDA